MTVVDKAKALDLLTQAIEVKGADHKQTSCYYLTRPDHYVESEEAMWSVHDNTEPKPGCLVGTALFLLDKDALIQTVIDYRINGDLIESGDVIAGLSENGIDLTDEAVEVFTTAQTLQDGRYPGVYGNRTWGEAVAVVQGSITVDDLPPAYSL